MAAFAIQVADFDGPLDLLIHLIEKNNVDIYDIPIASITEQYMAYLGAMQELDLDVATSFMVMASLLLQIKSRMLLPQLPSEDAEEEADPRQMLVQMLMEYRKVKAQAAALRERLTQAQRLHTRRPLYESQVARFVHPYTPQELLAALTQVLEALPEQVAVVERQEYDVGRKMQDMLARLRAHPEGVELRAAFASTGSRGETTASFLALLQLLKLQLVRVQQSMRFGPIYIFPGALAESAVTA